MPPYGHDRKPGPPRNYFGIPAAPTLRKSPFVPHDRLVPARHTGALELRIETLSDLHVGTGQYARHGGELVREPLRRNGLLAIPGASIKGSCRQVFEALSDSGAPFDFDERMPKLARDPRTPEPPLSAAAALFGTLGFQGRLSFDDAVPEAPVEARLIHLSAAYLPRREEGRRFYGLVPPGAQQPPRIPVWAIPAGTCLVTRVRFRNADEGEIGAVLLSLGIDGHFVPRLGGGKYDGHGCVRFSVTGVRLRAARGFGAPTRHDTPEALREFRERCAGAFVPTAKGSEALQQLRAQLVAPPSPETRA